MNSSAEQQLPDIEEIIKHHEARKAERAARIAETGRRNPCSSPSGNHSWGFVGNVTLKSETIASIRMEHVGAYRCIRCNTLKQGDAQKGAKELTFNTLHGVGARSDK